MQIRVGGFRVAPKTPLARWIVYTSIALVVIAILVRGLDGADDRRRRIERVAGFDMPGDLQPEWSTRPKRRSIGIDQAWVQGYRLSEGLAQQLMATCEQRGGRVVKAEQVRADLPELGGHVKAGMPACIRSEDRPTRAVAMLQEDLLVVRIRRY